MSGLVKRKGAWVFRSLEPRGFENDGYSATWVPRGFLRDFVIGGWWWRARDAARLLPSGPAPNSAPARGGTTGADGAVGPGKGQPAHSESRTERTLCESRVGGRATNSPTPGTMGGPRGL